MTDNNHLRDLYSTLKSGAKIARVLGVTRTTALGRLRRAGIIAPPPLKRVPPSTEVLHDMYCIKSMSIKDIARVFGETTWMVINWLEHAHITIRTSSQASRVGHIRYPTTENQRDAARKNMLRARHSLSSGSRNLVAFHRGAAKNNKIRSLRAQETRTCVCCYASIVKRQSAFKRPPERTFCSRHCAMKYRGRIQRLGYNPASNMPDSWKSQRSLQR